MKSHLEALGGEDSAGIFHLVVHNRAQSQLKTWQAQVAGKGVLRRSCVGFQAAGRPAFAENKLHTKCS
jgi:hypothetical protein